MKHFYLLQFGEHFRGLIKHTFFKSDAKYFEFVLHHSLAVLLIVFSYMTNYWLAGIMVMLVHDFSDALVKVARFYIDYRYKNEIVLKLIFVVAIAVWILLRIVVYTSCCLIPCFQALNIIYYKFQNL
jgi:ceramide synthetase